MKTLKYHVKDILIILFLLALNCIFFFDILFDGKVLFTGDNISLNIPGKFLLKSILQNGELPLWNPYLFSGMPFLADINFGVLAPLNFLYFIFNPFTANNINTVLGLWLTAIFMYMFCRIVKLPRISALISSIIFMFSGSVITNTLNSAILNVVMWLPLVMWSLELYLQKNTFKYGLLLSVICSFQLFSGHIQYTYLTWLFLCGYLVWKIKPFSLISIIKKCAVIFLPVLFLTSIQLMPFLEYSYFTTRPNQNITYAAGSGSLLSFIRLILPNFFGILKDGTSWGATADISGYIGLIAIFLFCYVFAFQKLRRNAVFYFLSALIFLLIALGKYSPLYQLAYYVLPFYARFRSPSAILILYTFSLSVAVGFGFKYLLQDLHKIKFKSFFFFQISSVLFFLFSILTLLIKYFGFNSFIHLIRYSQHVVKLSFFTRFLEYSQERMNIIYHLWMDNILISLFFLFLFSILTLITSKVKITLFHKVLFVLLISSEMIIFAGNIYISTENKNLITLKQYIKPLKDDKSIFRILTLKDEAKKPPFADPNYFLNEAIKSLSFLQSDTNLFHLIQSVDGYASMVYRPYAIFTSGKLSTDPTGIDLLHPKNTNVNELNVKYFLTAGRDLNLLQNNPQYRLLSSYFHPGLKRTFYLYQNVLTKNRVEFLNNTKGGAEIIKYKTNEIEIKTITDSPTILILRDVFYPGWYAIVNNQKQEIHPYGIFRSVHIPAGISKVKMFYQPVSIYAGALVSFSSWIFVLFYFGFSVFKNQKKVCAKLHIRKRKIKK